MAVRQVDSLNNLAVVPDDTDTMSEEDAAAEQALIAAFNDVRNREAGEVAAVEVPRYVNVPMRDAQGRLVRDEHGRVVYGPLTLYFHALAQGTMSMLRTRFTTQVPVKRRGRTEFEDRIDDEGLSYAMTYTAMVPWCRNRYYENQALWGNEPVGTGEEFFRSRLRIGEIAYCVEAVLKLEGLGDEREDQLKKA